MRQRANTITLNKLQIGDTFKLITKRYYVKNHIYKVSDNKMGVVKYVFAHVDPFKQETITNGKEYVIKLN